MQQWVYHGNLSRIEGGKRGYYKHYGVWRVQKTRLHIFIEYLITYLIFGILAYLGVLLMLYSGI
jgi:hypothetical protein